MVCASRCMCPTRLTSSSRFEIGEDERELEVEITWRSRPMPLTSKRLMASCARVRIEVLGFLPTPCAVLRSSQPRTVRPAFVGVIRIKQRRCLIMAAR